MESVLYSVDRGVGIVTLNRPAQLNAINTKLIEELDAALVRAIDAADVDIILLRANGRAFCAGDDLKELESSPFSDDIARHFVELLQAITRHLMLGSKPTICAAQGWIVGAGAAWPLNADFCLVASDATLFCPEAKYGLFPSGGLTFLMEDRCGPVLANDVLWLGKRLTAEELLKHGIASRLVEAETLSDEAFDFAQTLRAVPSISRDRLKRSRRSNISERLEQALDFESRCCIDGSLDRDVRTRVKRSNRP
jgi:enoyl-CoA hydratase/carnithine racemase